MLFTLEQRKDLVVENARSSFAKELTDAYRQLAESIKVQYVLDRVTYSAPVNFTEASVSPRHRWFPYKEGFSPKFVQDVLNRFLKGSSKGTVLDPFAGVGTTVIEAALLGHTAIGLDVSPMAVFIATTKAMKPHESEINIIKEDIKRFSVSELPKCADAPTNATVCSYFEPEYLDALLRIKAFVLERKSRPSRVVFMLALLANIENFSTHRKAGNGLKKKTRFKYRDQLMRPIDQVKESVKDLVSLYVRDLERTPLLGSASFRNESSLEAYLPRHSFDCLLTSPPYANCFDYSKIYLCELWLGGFFSSSESQRLFRQGSVRSHVHARWAARYGQMGSKIIDQLIVPSLSKKKLWSKSIPQMLNGYFADLGQVLNNVSESLRPGAHVGFVVSNSAYGGLPIATDLLLCELGIAQGYIAEEIIVYRKIIPSSQQFVELIDKSYLRESLVILRKQ